MRVGRRLRWVSIFKPTKPSEAYALALLCFLLGGALVGGVKKLVDQPPWRERADRWCYEQGNKYLAIGGNSEMRLRAQVQITEDTLNGLRAMRDAVSTEDLLTFNSLLDDKELTVAVLRRLIVARGDPAATTQLRTKLAGISQAYASEASEIGLAVCGQGTGQQ